jgi:phosphopantetheine binding protein
VALVAIWREVLGHPRVGIYDNFFALGGNSILSIQIVARAIRAGIALDIKLVHLYQTIAELSAAIEEVIFASEPTNAL